MRSAFRNLGMARQSWQYLIIKAVSLTDGHTYYFVDKCIPFGAAISCAHFQKFSNAMAHIVSYRTGKILVNYLDDFLFIALLKLLCDNQVREFLAICQMINFPISEEKTFWGTTMLTFLGSFIDSVSQTVSLPTDKILKGKELIVGKLP